MNFPLWLAFTLAASQAIALEPLPTQYVVDSWSIATGIPEETIYSVTQTGDGYLWLATANGLVQYDGNSFRVHQPRKDLGGAAKQEIDRSGPGPRNSTWVHSGTYGLMRYENGVFRRAPNYPRPCNVLQIHEDGDGTLIVCGERILRIVGEKVEQLTKATTGIVSAARGKDGSLWVGLADSGLATVSDDGSLTIKYGKKEGFPGGSVNAILAVAPDRLWVGTASGLALIEKGRVELFTTRHGLPSSRIRRITLGRDGALWIGTEAGLSLYRNNRFESFRDVKGLPADTNSQAIFEDRENNVWVTGSPTGLFRLRKPKFLTWGRTEGLVTDRPVAVLQSHGATWVAHASGLQRIRGAATEQISLGGKSIPLQSLEEDGAGRIWALTADGAFVVDPNNAKAQRVIFPDGSYKMFSANRDRAGRIWIVSDKGLFLGEGHEVRAINFAGLPIISRRSDVRQSPDGRFWLSVSKAGLFELRDGKAHRVSLGADPELNRIHCFYVASNNDFWLGLDGGGLARWRDGKLARYGHQTTDALNFVYNIAEDKDGYLWLGLRAGLVRVSKSELNDYLDGRTAREPKEHRYDIADGLRSFNFGLANRTVPSYEPSSLLWFCSLAGVVRVDTRRIPLNRVLPPVHLAEVTADDRPLPLESEVRVPAGSGLLRFEFSIPSLVDRSHVLVRSRLEPFDSAWRTHRARNVTYSQVPPGQYTFRVSASNNDDVWNEEGLKIRVVVMPYFYQTWWFLWLLSALGIATVVALYRWRTMLLRREKAALEERVERRTAELSKAKQAAEHASQVKSDFLATMSHEIRTPMHGVLGTVDLLSETPLSIEQRNYLDTVRSSSNSLLTLLNDILDLSKMEAGRMDLRPAPFSLRQTIEEVAALLRAQANFKRVSIVVSYDPDLPEHFHGDELRVRQVVFNLAGNAVKFTEEGQVTLEITGQQKPDGTWNVNVAVRDTGIGISPEHVPQLFQSFVQVNSSLTRRYTGSGLGLAICQRLADKMDGSISVESTVAEGSTFTFALSLPEATPLSTAGEPVLQRPVRRRFSGNLLVAEDNSLNQRLAIALLERLGCTVTLAENGRQAVQLAQTLSFPVIFMDCQMPEMDGLEAARKIRATVGDGPVIVAMTANALPDDRERCLAAGMNDYLTKPFQLPDLVAVLDRYMPADCMPIPEVTELAKA